MRPFPLLLATLALVVAGCASPEGDGDAGGTTPATGTPTTTPASGGSGVPNEVHLTHDHTEGQDATATFTLNATARYDVSIGFREREGAPACAGVNMRITVTSADGEVVANTESTNLQAPCGGSGSEQGGKTLEAGEYTVEFSGRGAVIGFVDIVPT